jgi:hypothetical protein
MNEYGRATSSSPVHLPVASRAYRYPAGPTRRPELARLGSE